MEARDGEARQVTLAHEPTDEDLFALELDAQGLKSRALRGSALIGGAQVAKMVVQLGSTMVLGRLLFPADFGLVAMVYPIVGFIQLCGNLGFSEAIVQRDKIRQADVSALFWLNMAISVGIALVGSALSPVAAWLYQEPRVVPLMIAISAIIPIGALGSVHGSILSRHMRFAISTRNELVSTWSGVAVTIGAAAAGYGYWSLVIGQAATAAIGLALAWSSVWWRPSRPALAERSWEDLRFGANLTAANIATFITASGDNVIVGALNGKIALGIYDRSYRLVVQPVGQLLTPISSVALPLLSRLLSDPLQYRQVYLNFVRLILLLTLPLMLVCIVNAEEIVTLLLGARWNAAAATFAWISVGGLMSGLYSSLPWLFVSQARTASMRRYMSAAAVFNLLSFAIGARWGVVGVAACAAVTFLLVTVPLVTFGATRSGPVALADLCRCALPYGATALVAAAGALLVNRTMGDGVAKLVCSVFTCSLPFLILAGASPNERGMVLFAYERVRSALGRRPADLA